MVRKLYNSDFGDVEVHYNNKLAYNHDLFGRRLFEIMTPEMRKGYQKAKEAHWLRKADERKQIRNDLNCSHDIKGC